MFKRLVEKAKSLLPNASLRAEVNRLLIENARLLLYASQARHTAVMLAKETEHLRAQVMLAKETEHLRAQVMQVRVSQATEGRTGWEVMCYIPESIIQTVANSPEHRRWLIEDVARQMVDYAIKGIVKLNGEGKVNALVFAPLNINGPVEAPQWVQALYSKDGKFKMSAKAHIVPPSEEQRAKRASGLY